MTESSNGAGKAGNLRATDLACGTGVPTTCTANGDELRHQGGETHPATDCPTAMMPETLQSSGRTVLVTGASRRLGRVIALELARRSWRLALHFRSSKAEANELKSELYRAGVEAEIFQADLADEQCCATLIPAVVRRFGRLDAVINNASTFEYDNVQSFSHAAMDRHWKANTAPAVILSRALYDHLQEVGRLGCVVNLTDQKLWNPNPDFLSYTLSKAALEASTTLLAQALGPVVRVCGVAPGVTLISGDMSAESFRGAHASTLLRRSSEPGDIATAVAFLLESPAITGSTLLVDGGQHLSHQPRDVAFLNQTPS